MSKFARLLNGSTGLVWPALAATACMAAGAADAAASADRAVLGASHVAGPLHSVGVINLKALGAEAARTAGQAASGLAPAESRGRADYRAHPFLTFRPKQPFSEALEATRAPSATAVAKVVNATSVNSFSGLDHNDQRTIADNGNQFSEEPPDQALAVGGSFIVESINNALQVFDKNGNALLAAPVSMNRFFGQISEFNRTTLERGPSISDPRAYYDASTGRFIVAEWGTLNDAAGVPLNISVQFVAVSQTSDPTAGWFVYSYETTNGDVPGCPCLPDFNQLGGDRHGVYITSSLFNITDLHFVGTKIYALSKAALEAGPTGPTSVSTFPLMPNDFTVFPTIAPPHGRFAQENRGTEYFVEGTADLTNSGVGHRMKIFAITNTDSLATGSPNLSLQSVTLLSQRVDANMPPAVQKSGPRPLGGFGPGGLGEPKPLLASGDGRVGSTPMYVNGAIWAVSGTAVRDFRAVRDGVAWFKFQTGGTDGPLNVTIADQGIIAAPDREYLTYPVIGINAAGTGAIGVTIVGPHRFPSTATIAMPAFGSPTITVSGVGALPDDGFTAYAFFGGNGVGRWGDYGGASVDGSGNVWIANEYIPQTTTARPRSINANYGTFITKIAP